jgi:hypothetical protein
MRPRRCDVRDLPRATPSGTLARRRPSMRERSSPPARSGSAREPRLGANPRWLLPAAWLLRALAATWRIEVRGADPLRDAGPLLAGMWHENGLVAAGVYRDRGYHVLVSRSRDGERIDRVLARLGFGQSSRGSSSRAGAQALLGARRILATGGVAGILVDGPRGPARVAKSGAISAARVSGVPVWPVAFAARPCLRFASWDRMRLPLPFARVILRFGEPLAVPREASDADVEALRARFEARLLVLAREVDAELEGPRSPRA